MTPAWAAHVPLLPNELFSTWLARAALIQGCDPMVLTGSLWPGWRAWARDLDRGICAGRLDVLAKRSGISHAQLERATLRPMLSVIAPQVSIERPTWPWVMAQGSRNRRRFGGLQYCSPCLAEDREPYFRRNWRLAWHVGCRRHGCLLSDHCSRCLAPAEPHRCRVVDQVLSLCPNCGFDLRAGKTETVCMEALAFQCEADKVAQMGYGISGGSKVASGEWFATASRHAAGRIRVLAMDQAPLALTALPLILQRPSERVLRLRMAYRGMHGSEKGNPVLEGLSKKKMCSGRESVNTPMQIKQLPPPRPRAKVNGEWIRMLRRLRVGQP